MKRHLWIFFVAIALCGCGGGDSSGSEEQPAAPTPFDGATGEPADAGRPGDPTAGPGGPPPGAGAQAPAGGGAGAGASVNGVTLTSQAGVPVTQMSDPGNQTLKELASAKRPAPRRDPWSLLAAERKYESEQTTARLTDELGGFGQYFKPEQDVVDSDPIIVQAPPSMRLAGVILGNGVVALLEVNGKVIDIRPGTQIDAEWVVSSIDEEKAVLKRLNKKRPHEVVVPLSSKLDLPGGGNG